VAFVTWFSGLRTGLVLSLLCTGLWSVNNINTSLLITSWNIVSTSFFFAAIAAVMNKTRHLWENEKVLSRTDPLTGVKNLRAFSELVEYEISLALRDGLPFSLVYLDLDNFKAVNDTYGHTAGDKLLTSIAGSIVGNLRKTDVIGRLGGDEFAIFFPGTDQPSVQVVMLKISHELDRLMKNSQLPTTFSIGVITCSGGLYDFNELIGYADTLMYEVKHSGKNNIRYGTCPPAPREFPPRAPADR
jgi:diguanylate cyclase (GGDEF)-like protein